MKAIFAACVAAVMLLYGINVDARKAHYSVPAECVLRPWNCMPWGPVMQKIMCHFFGKCPR